MSLSQLRLLSLLMAPRLPLQARTSKCHAEMRVVRAVHHARRTHGAAGQWRDLIISATDSNGVSAVTQNNGTFASNFIGLWVRFLPVVTLPRALGLRKEVS